MFTKIIITFLVIVGALVALRYKGVNVKQAELKQSAEAEQTQLIIKWIVFGVLSFSLLTGTVLYYLDWRDEHRVYQVKIVNPQTGKEETYKAYRKDLKGRSFTTLTGQQLKVSDLERLEITEL